MKVLIAYGSTEGQTRKIVKTVTKQVTEMGHDVAVFDTSGLLGDLHPAAFDKIIVAGSVHVERHQETMELFVLSHLEELRSKPALFISVSLAAAFDDGMIDAQGYVDSFAKYTGWTPKKALLVAGAVRHGEYGYYEEHILEHIVIKDPSMDAPSKDHEFTDWNVLTGDVERFIAN
ncbi:MAG: flavodoxin domain-containing protein [Rhizobiaceae bacterium]